MLYRTRYRPSERSILLTLESLYRFNFSNNTLLNTVLQFDVNYVSDTTESIVVAGNKLSFTRPLLSSVGATPIPAILTGGANVKVTGNVVESVLLGEAFQSPDAVGIAVSQTGYETTRWPRTNGPNGQRVQSSIIANKVSGFQGRTAIRFLGNTTNATMVYPVRIELNTVDGAIDDCSPHGHDELDARGNCDWGGHSVNVSRPSACRCTLCP